MSNASFPAGGWRFASYRESRTFVWQRLGSKFAEVDAVDEDLQQKLRAALEEALLRFKFIRSHHVESMQHRSTTCVIASRSSVMSWRQG